MSMATRTVEVSELDGVFGAEVNELKVRSVYGRRSTLACLMMTRTSSVMGSGPKS